MSFPEEEIEFLQGAAASVIIPARQDLSINELFEDEDIEQRQTLFFDERLKVYAILEFPVCPEDVLKSYLARIELKVDAWAIAAEHGDRRFSSVNDPNKDLVASESICNLGDPVTLVKQNDDESNVSLNLIWEIYMTINKPRMRLIEPSVEFVPNAIISARPDSNKHEQYLESFSTLEPNVLAPLQSFNGIRDVPYLPISRLEKVIPSKPKEEARVRFAYTASDLIKAYQAISVRFKYKSINTHSPAPTTIASLDIDVIPMVEVAGVIEKAEVSLVNGKVEALMQDFLPMSCRSKDSITLLYKLISLQHSSTHPLLSGGDAAPAILGKDIGTLNVSILICLQLPDTSKASISMNWTTNVDFSQALNPSYGPPSQPIQRTNRPSSLPFGTGDPRTAAHSTSSSLQAVLHPPGFGQPSRDMANILTISFIAPDLPVKVGVPFTWRVLIVNRSTNLVRLALIPLPRMQRATNAVQQYSKRHAPKVSSISVSTPTAAPAAVSATIPESAFATNVQSTTTSTRRQFSGLDIARAHVDENVLYALHHSGAVPPETDLVSLTAELRIGPLGVGQCHESEIKFVAFKEGAFGVDVIRVVDLVKEAEEGIGAQGVVMDLRDLPDVIVEADSNEEQPKNDNAVDNEGGNAKVSLDAEISD